MSDLRKNYEHLGKMVGELLADLKRKMSNSMMG